MAKPQPAGKRLLAINNYFYRRGGAEAVFFDHMTMFERIGWDVVPFAMQHEDNEPSPWSDYFVSEIEYGRQTSPLRKVVQAASIIYSVEAQRNIARLIEQARPSVAHAHNVYHHLSPAIFSTLKSAGIPVVMTAHDLKPDCPSYKMLRDGKICEDCRGGHIYNVLRHRCIKGSVPYSTLVHRRKLWCIARSAFTGTSSTASSFPAASIWRSWSNGAGPASSWNTYRISSMSSVTAATGRSSAFVFAAASPEKGLATSPIKAVALSKQRLVVAGTGPDEAYSPVRR